MGKVYKSETHRTRKVVAIYIMYESIRKVAGSIPNEATDFLQLHNPCSFTITLV